MSGDVTVELIGGDRLVATLGDAADGLGRMSRADARAMNVVTRRAQARAPKRTGRLSRSVHGRRTDDGVEVLSQLVYAPVIHNGWPGHNIRANPFLADALDAAAPEVVDIYSAGVGEALAQVKGA